MGDSTQYFNKDWTYKTARSVKARTRLNLKAYAQHSKGLPLFVQLSLEGSAVAAGEKGKLAYDDDDTRGYYTESVRVEMSLDNPQFVIQQDAPPTVSGSASTTSTTGISINEQAGTFGPIPTTGVGGGITIGSSFSKNLSDFEVANNSSDTTLSHSYVLSASEGGTYGNYKDLVDESAGGQLTFQTNLYELPKLAKSNLPIISQGIWMTKSTTPKLEDVKVVVTVVHLLRWVNKKNEVFSVKIKEKSLTETLSYKVPLADLAKIDA